MLSQQELELASEQQRQPCRLQRHTVVMPQGLDASSLTWTGLDCAALCGGDERWGKGRGVRLIRSVSPHPLPAFPIYHFEDKDSHTKRCPQHQCLHPLRGKVQSLREKTKLNSFSVLLLSPPSTPHCPLPVGWSYDVGLRTHCNNPHSVCSIPVWGEQLMILGLFSWILWHDDMDFFLHFEIWNPNIWLSFWGNSHPLPWQDDPFGRLHYLKLNVCQHALQHHSYKNCCLYFSPAPLQDRLLKDMMPRTSIMHQVFFVGAQWQRSERAGYTQHIIACLILQPRCQWTPVWLSGCLTRKSWYPACMEMDNCCCCLFYLHIHLFATPTTWHLVWYHVERRDIHASNCTQDWFPSTLSFWPLVWIIILQRQILLDYFFPPFKETFRLCWQFAKRNQELCGEPSGYGDFWYFWYTKASGQYTGEHGQLW